MSSIEFCVPVPFFDSVTFAASHDRVITGGKINHFGGRNISLDVAFSVPVEPNILRTNVAIAEVATSVRYDVRSRP
jgi:hypothetical protein